MVGFKPLAAIAALALVNTAQAWYNELPSCESAFTPFTYKGCFDNGQRGSPEALSLRSDLDQQNMTVEICTAHCKGNDYRLAGLSYYGVCYCGQTVQTTQLAEDQCTFPCSGNNSETCGGDTQVNIWSDPTFPPLEQQTSVDEYKPVGCWTDDSSQGKALFYRQNNLDTATLTTEICLQSCLSGGFPFAGTEYGGECYCGVILGAGTGMASDQSTCNMPCNGNSNEICGGPSRLSLYVAKDLQSTEPCTNPPDDSSTITPGPSTSTTTTTTSSSTTTMSDTTTTTESTITTSDTTTTTDSSTTTTTTEPSTTTTESSTTTTTTDVTTPPVTSSSTTTTETSTTTESSTTSTVPPTSTTTESSSTTTTPEPSNTPTSTSTVTVSTPPVSSSTTTTPVTPTTTVSTTFTIPTITITIPTTTPSSSLTTTTSTTSVSTVTVTVPGTSTTTSVPSSSSTTSSTPVTTVSTTTISIPPTSTTTSASSSSTTTSETPITTVSTTTITIPSTSVPTTTSSTSLTGPGTSTTTPPTTPLPSTTTTLTPVCTSTSIVPPTCEYAVGSWCSNPLPSFHDSASCASAWNQCTMQAASCFRKAGFPASLSCYQYQEWCSELHSYCQGPCTSRNCGKDGFTGTCPPKGGNAATTSVVTIACPTTMATTTAAATTSACPMPTPTGICTQPNNPHYGYAPGHPVGGIGLPVVTCNNVKNDWDHGNVYKLYTDKDSRKCPSYPSGQGANACADACKAQMQQCEGTYVEGCRTGRFAQGWRDAKDACQWQYQDCVRVNRGVGGGHCENWMGGC